MQDTDGDGMISRSELRAYVRKVYKTPDERESLFAIVENQLKLTFMAMQRPSTPPPFAFLPEVFAYRDDRTRSLCNTERP